MPRPQKHLLQPRQHETHFIHTEKSREHNGHFLQIGLSLSAPRLPHLHQRKRPSLPQRPRLPQRPPLPHRLSVVDHPSPSANGRRLPHVSSLQTYPTRCSALILKERKDFAKSFGKR